MRRIVIECEVFITEKEWMKFRYDRTLVWDVNNPVATVFDKPIKIKRAYVDETYVKAS